jgi:hypothetical protein
MRIVTIRLGYRVGPRSVVGQNRPKRHGQLESAITLAPDVPLEHGTSRKCHDRTLSALACDRRQEGRSGLLVETFGHQRRRPACLEPTREQPIQ